MSKFFLHPLSSGRTVQVTRGGTVIFDAEGRPDTGNLSNSEWAELRQLHAAAYAQDQDGIAVSRQGDPRFPDIRDEIFRRGSPAEIEAINENPVLFNQAFEALHGEVGPSLDELQRDIDRSDEAAAIEDRLRDADTPLGGSQSMEDVGRLLDLKEGK